MTRPIDSPSLSRSLRPASREVKISPAVIDRLAPLSWRHPVSSPVAGDDLRAMCDLPQAAAFPQAIAAETARQRWCAGAAAAVAAAQLPGATACIRRISSARSGSKATRRDGTSKRRRGPAVLAALVLAGIVAAPIGTAALLVQARRRSRTSGAWPAIRRFAFAIGGTAVLGRDRHRRAKAPRRL